MIPAALSDSKVRLVLEIDKDFKVKLNEGKPFLIKLVYDKSQAKSEGSIGIVSHAINEFNSRIISNRLADLGVDEDILQPAKIEETNIANEAKSFKHSFHGSSNNAGDTYFSRRYSTCYRFDCR